MIRFSKIEHNVRRLFPRLLPYFESEPAVEFAYLFGSFAEGTETPLSDVDIAVFLSPMDKSEDSSRKQDARGRYLGIRLRIMADVSHLLHTNEVDVIILNEADLLLRYQAVSTREVLFERNPERRIDFEVETISRYLDTQPFRRVQQEYFIQQIREGSVFG